MSVTNREPAPSPAYRVLVTDLLTPGRVAAQGRHYESPPQTEQQAHALIAVLIGIAPGDLDGPWRQAIAGGQRIIQLQRAAP